jgi:hypothetical protein
VPPIVKAPVLVVIAPITSTVLEFRVPLLVILKLPPVRVIPGEPPTFKPTPDAALIPELIVPVLFILTVPPVWIKAPDKIKYSAPLNAVGAPTVLVLVMFKVPPAIEEPNCIIDCVPTPPDVKA